MNKISLRMLPAALAVALASIGLSAVAQTQPAPTTTEKVEGAGEKAWDATKSGTKKAVNATKTGTKKAWNATKRGTKKAVTATENAGTAAADKTRQVGDKIGEKIPGTAQNEAAKGQAPKKP
jgi:hypothetical protein